MKDTDIIAAIAPDAVSLMDKAIAEIKRLRQENATLTAERDEAIIRANNNNLKQKQDNGCGCYGDPPCRGCKEEMCVDHPECAAEADAQGCSEDEKMIDITPTWPEMVRIIAALMESGTDTGKRAAFEELKRMADVMTTYRIQRDEAIIHANNIIREARSIVVPSRMSTSGYWDAVDNFRRFESKTT